MESKKILLILTIFSFISLFSIFVLATAPDQITEPNNPADGETGVSTSPTLNVTPTDPDGDVMNVSFYAEKLENGDFELGNISGWDSGSCDCNDPSCDNLDCTNIYNNVEWYAQDNYTKEGIFAARGADISDSQMTWINQTVTLPEPANLTFSWMKSCEPYDQGIFLIDGVQKGSLTDAENNGVWYNEEYELSEGTHELKWIYTKDYSISDYNDTIFLDNNDFLLTTNTSVSNNTPTTYTWSGLSTGTTYNWFVEVTDGTDTTQSSTWSFTTNYVPDKITEPNNPPDGEKIGTLSPTLNVTPTDPDGDVMNVSFYNATPWDLTRADYTGTSLLTQDYWPMDLFFKSDGKKLYEIGSDKNLFYQYSCLDAWNLSSCSYNNVNLSTQDTGPTGMFWKPDGTKLYEVCSDSDKFYQYSCSDPWNLTSCNYNNINKSVQDVIPEDIFFKPDGTKMYEVGKGFESIIYQYNCSDPWNLTSCTYENIEISIQEGNPRGIFFNGTKLYQVESTDAELFQYSCSDPWNLTSCDYDNINISTQDSVPLSVFFKSDGTKMYEVGQDSGKFYQYSLTDLLTTNTSVSNNTPTTYTWSGLSTNTTYDWYVEVTDGTETTQSSLWNFTTYKIVKRYESNSISVTDSPSREISSFRDTQELITTTDSFSTLANIFRTKGQGININTFMERLTSIFRTPSQELDIFDEASRLTSISRTPSQPLNLDTTVSRLVSFTRMITQTFDFFTNVFRETTDNTAPIYSNDQDDSGDSVKEGTIINVSVFWEDASSNLDFGKFYHNASGNMEQLKEKSLGDYYLYTASKDNAVKKISSNGTEVWTFGDTYDVGGVQVDSDGYVYSAYDEELNKIYPNGTEVWTFTGFNGEVYDLGLDKEGNVYGASWDNTLRKIDENGNEVWSFTGHSDYVLDAAVYNNSVFSVSADNTAKKINITCMDTGGTSSECTNWTFTSHSETVIAVDVLYPYLYTGSYDDTIKKINITCMDTGGTSSECTNWTFTGHTGDVEDVKVDSDRYVYSASAGDNTARKITPQGTEVWTYQNDDQVGSVSVDSEGYVYVGESPNITKLTSGGDKVWTFTGHSNIIYGLDTGVTKTDSDWYNTTINTIGDSGKTICWKQYANDTAGNLNDTMTNTDHCFYVIQKFSKQAKESFTLSDTISRIISSLRISSDTFTFSETVSRIPTRVKTLGEDVSLNSISTRLVSIFRTQEQPATLTDRISTFRTLPKTIEQSFTLNTISKRLSSISRTLGQKLQITTQISTFRILPQTLQQKLNINTASERISSIFRTERQETLLSSSVNRLASAFRTEEQNLPFTTSVNRIPTRVKNIGEGIDINTFSDRVSSIFRTEGQEIAFTDQISKFSTRVKSLGQDVSINTITKRLTSISRTFRQQIPLLSQISIIPPKRSLHTDYSKTTVGYKPVYYYLSFPRISGQKIQFGEISERLTNIYRTGIQKLFAITEIKVSRPYAKYFRTLSQSLNLNTITQRLMEGFRTTSKSIGIDTAITTFRTLPPQILSETLNMNTAISTFKTLPKTIRQSLDLNTLTERLTSIFRTQIQGTTASTTVSTFRRLPQNLGQQLDINTASERLTNIFRTEGQSININTFTTKFTTRLKEITQPIGLNEISTRITQIFRTKGQEITLSEITESFKRIPTTITQTLSLDSTLQRFRIIPETLSQPLQLNTLTERTTSIFRTLTEPISITPQTFTEKIPAAVKISKTLTQSIQLTETVERITQTFRSTSQPLNFNTISQRLSTAYRTPTQSLTMTVKSLREIASTRDIGQDISVITRALTESSIFRIKGQPLNINIITERLTSIFRTQGQPINITSSITSFPRRIVQTTQSINLQEDVSRQLTSFKTLTEDINVQTFNGRTTEITRTVTQFFQMFFETTTETTIPPVIRWTELNIDNLGNQGNYTLRLNITDRDSNLDKITFNGIEKDISGGDDVFTLDISETNQSGTITVTDKTDAEDTYSINFTITNHNYQQIATTYNLSYQELEKNDTITNYASDDLEYNISHYTEGTTTGEDFTGTLTTDSSSTLFTNMTGDLLTESISDWKLRENFNHTTQLQYIRKGLNITNNFDDWENISVGNQSIPSDFSGTCNTTEPGTLYSFCGDHNIPITSSLYSTNVEWKHYGTGIERDFIEDITDVEIGERTQYWDKYRYRNLTTEPFYYNITVNETISYKDIEWGGEIQVRIDGTYKNLTLTEEDNCDTNSPNLYGTNINETFYKGCYKYLNSTTVYFKWIIPEFNDTVTTEEDYYVKYIAFTTEAPEEEVAPTEGATCEDQGDTYEMNKTTLECYRGRWFEQEEIGRPIVDFTIEFYKWISYIILFIGFLFIIALIIIRRDDVITFFKSLEGGR